MTDLRQAAQQALEAMGTNQYTVAELAPHKVVMKFNDAITALRTALEQQQAEPVAVERWLWIFEDRHGDRYTHKNLFYTADEAAESARICGVKAIKKIESSKVMQQAEPVAWMDKHGNIDHGLDAILEPEGWKPLYTIPPQRQWDKPSASFNAWWDSDYDDAANPYEPDSAAYWAWAGWEAAQRPWVGLTDEELDGIAVVARRGNLHDLRIAIEAKLKERNT